MASENAHTRVAQKELDLIRANFADPESILLKSIRALFFNLEPTETEKNLVKNTFSNPELLAMMWRRFCPKLDRDTPIGQVEDVWMGVEEMVFGVSASTIYQAVHYKEDAINMVKKCLNLLVDPEGEKVDLEYTTAKHPLDEFQISLLARNMFIKHVEQQLVFLMIIANDTTGKFVSTETREKDKQKDSAK